MLKREKKGPSMGNATKEVIPCKSWCNCSSATLHDQNVLRQMCEFLFILTISSCFDIFNNVFEPIMMQLFKEWLGLAPLGAHTCLKFMES